MIIIMHMNINAKLCVFCSSDGVPMTLQSLCTAIRSQLYFSQVTAWTDLLKTSAKLEDAIRTNPRIKNASKIEYKPKLDVLYRIRSYDETSCFNATPVEHHFPETMITESLCVKVALKSLPRMKSIPQLQYATSKISLKIDIDEETVQPIVMDDRLEFSCNEKGKHRCPFDDELATDEMDTVSIPISTSHRDKQLNKYMKRIQRRDKKKRTGEGCSQATATETGIQSASTRKTTDASNADVISTAATTNIQYEHTINSIQPPLYSSMNVPTATAANASQATVNLSKCTQTSNVVMASVATQTDNSILALPNCDFCGVEMQYFCWNCDKKMFAESRIVDKADLLLQAIKRTPVAKQLAQCNAAAAAATSAGSVNAKCDTKEGSKSTELSDLCCKRQKTVHNFFVSSGSCHANNNIIKNNNNNIDENFNINHNSNTNNGNVHLEHSICSVNDARNTMETTRYYDDSSALIAIKKEMAMAENIISGGYRRTLSESVVGTCISGDIINNALELDLAASQGSISVITNEELKQFRRAYSEDELICNCDDNRPKQAGDDADDDNRSYLHTCDKYQSMRENLPLSIRDKLIIDDQFKTPTANSSIKRQQKINPLYISCRDDGNSNDSLPSSSNVSTSKLSKAIPKVNLTKLFGGIDSGDLSSIISNDLDVEAELAHMSNLSMPISLSSVFNFDNLSPPLPSPTSGAFVQKSQSAPSFAHSPVLSPRFLKSTQIFKRRSRHLSDRSSIGSDEQFSDDEFHQYACDNEKVSRPGILPSKAALKLFPKNYDIRRRALLGKKPTS